MTPAEYAFVQRYLKERSGLILSDDKRYLVESRLGPVARQAGLDLSQLIGTLGAGRNPALEQTVVEAMTINESSFFRDRSPFDHLTEAMLPQLAKARHKERRLRIWCAASSTGQEPYSIAMLVKENAALLAGCRVEIVATDIANSIIERAREGVFSQFDVQRGLPIKYLTKHFTQDDDKWRINADIRAMVQFRPLNLLRDFSPLGMFDIVFCRNVLIYFEEAMKRDVMNRIARQCADDGFFVMGAAETTVGLVSTFEPHATRRGIYVKPAVKAGGVEMARRAIA